MKISKGYMLREVAGNYVVVPVGEATKNFRGVITLNEVGAFLWKTLTNETTEEEVIEKLCAEYDVDKETAKRDTEAFIQKINDAGIMK